MQALILAAGYATRLYPLTIDTPKALLPIGQSCMLSFIWEGLKTIPNLSKIHLVTNARFACQFEQWNEKNGSPMTIWNDGTTGNEDRLGALGDVKFVLERAAIDDDLMVLASDNFFTFPLVHFYDAFVRTGKDTLLAGEIDDVNELRRFAVAKLDENGIVQELVEKPQNPASTTAIYAMYLYRRDTLPLILQYLAQGNAPDSPGLFPQWLYKRREVHAWIFDGECVDIGTKETYREVCEKYGGK